MIDQKFKFTTAEAVAFIKAAKRGWTFALHVRSDALHADSEDRYFPGGLSTFVNLDRKAAERVVSELLSPALEAKGGRIRVSTRSHEDYRGRVHTTVWIGGV